MGNVVLIKINTLDTNVVLMFKILHAVPFKASCYIIYHKNDSVKKAGQF